MGAGASVGERGGGERGGLGLGEQPGGERRRERKQNGGRETTRETECNCGRDNKGKLFSLGTFHLVAFHPQCSYWTKKRDNWLLKILFFAFLSLFFS